MRISDWSSDVCSSDLGIHSALGVKVTGPDLRGISELTAQLETILRGVAGTRAVFGDRLTGGRYIDVDIARVRAAKYGDRKSVVSGKRVSVRVELGGRRLLKKHKHTLPHTNKIN